VKKLLLILFILVFGVATAKSQDGSSYEGRHFLVGFMQNENYIQQNTGLLLQLFITSKEDVIVTIKQPYYPAQQYLLQKDSILTVNIDEKLETYNSEVPINNAIEITADKPITVTAYSSQWKTTDSYAAIPVDKWGTRYVVLSNPNDQYKPPPDVPPIDSARLAEPRSSEFMVIAAYDSTVITFRPRALTWKAKQIYKHYSVMLNKGDCYLVKSYPVQKGMGDLTGTIVVSNKPVGFLSGHVRTAVPQFLIPLWDSKNHLVEMLQPVKSWGRKFATIKMLPYHYVPHGDMIRVTGFYPNTKVTVQTRNGFQSHFLKDSGDFVSLKYFDSPAFWTSDKPVQIGQYMMRSGHSTDVGGYDPALVTIPPLEQFVQKVNFITPGNPIVNPEQFRYHFVSLIAEKRALNSLVYDGKLIANFTPIMSQVIPGTDYHYARFSVPQGRHQITCQRGGFIATLIGVGDADAYAHIIGASVVNPFRHDTIPPVIEFNYECGRVSGYAFEPLPRPYLDTINTGLDYAQVIKDSTYNFTWNITPIEDTTTYIEINAQVIDIRQDGMFVIDIRDKNGNGERHRFVYHRLTVNTPSQFNFGDIDARDSICKDFNIINEGADTLLVKTSYLAKNDNRVRYVLDKKLPYYLLPGDTIKGTLCFEPRNDTSKLDNQLVIIYDCDLVSRIPVTANVLNYDLWAKGFDFGVVKVGDSVCASVFLVNSGNTPVVIDSLEFDSTVTVFFVDTAGVFPVTVAAGDTFRIRVCFEPDSVASFTNNIYWRNSKINNIKSRVTGQGAGPNFPSVVIDWGRRRVGTQNDTIIAIKNFGNIHGIIKYNSTITDSDEFNKIDLLAVNYLIQPGETVEINSSYLPTVADTAQFIVRYEVDWKLHKPVIYELRGIGTIPRIKTYDIDFGVVRIFSSNDTTAPVIVSEGNERLKVMSGFVENADIDDFSIDLTQFDDLTLPVGDIFSANVNFTPNTIGYHEAIIGIVSDAAPGYGLDTVYFRLMGMAIPLDTVDFVQSISGPDEIINCQDNIYNYSITNTGNIEFNITNLLLNAVNLNASWVNTPSLPIALEPDSTEFFDIILDSEQPGDASLEVTAVVNDTISKRKTKYINVQRFKVQLGTIDGFKAQPGDSLKWEISGYFPNRVKDSVKMFITLGMRMYDYKITSNEAILRITGDSIDNTIICDVVQTIDAVSIIPRKSISISEDKLKWNIVLPFFVFLSDERYPVIDIYVSTDRCFAENLVPVPTEIGEVCVINMRAVVADKSVFAAGIYPNPARNEIKLDYYFPEEIEAEIEIIDINGKKTYLKQKIILKKGNNSRIFEISSLTNGVYVFKITSRTFIKNIKFIIIK
jgi:hypothetical protein